MSSKNNPISTSSKIKVGITIGDPSGIGPAITLKALKALSGKAEFTVIADKGILDNVNKRLSLSFRKNDYRCIDLSNVRASTFTYGKTLPEYGRASVEYLDRAIALFQSGKIDCLVTAPVSKESISLAGRRFFGHTEYLADKCHVKHPLMMLLNHRLKFILLTRHIPLSAVPGRISPELIERDIILASVSLKDLFALSNPRIVVCGLNPHASDNGVIGKEENAVFKPVLNKLRRKLKITLDGPLSADIAIARAHAGEYDCVAAAFHDQALIPLKLLGNHAGVNLTLGLPFVRTSPLHGTAFDIAGCPQRASADSMIQAIKTAIQCTQNQRKD